MVGTAWVHWKSEHSESRDLAGLADVKNSGKREPAIFGAVSNCAPVYLFHPCKPVSGCTPLFVGRILFGRKLPDSKSLTHRYSPSE